MVLFLDLTFLDLMYVVLRDTWIYFQFPRAGAWGKEGDVRALGLGGCMGGPPPTSPGPRWSPHGLLFQV